MREEIRQRLKEIIVRALRLDGITPDQVGDDQPLLGSEWDLDSIDMLQLIVEVEKAFGIKLVSGEFDRTQWTTVDTLAGAIEKRLQARLPS